MIEDPEHIAPRTLAEKYQEHRFLIMIGVVIVIALFLIGVALALYASSGAAQLDLSRPGYQSVREQAGKGDTFNGFSASGEIDDAALEQFQTLYSERVKQAVGVESFGGTGMSDDNLSIDASN